jgi:hypothetical protein
MKGRFLLAAAVLLTACSRNPDPEYAPDNDDAVEVVVVDTPAAAVETQPQGSAAPATEAPAGPLVSAVPEARAFELGREVFAMLNAGAGGELWDRFDAQMKAALGTADAFAGMITSMQDQLGPEMELLDELVGVPEEAPGLTYYRRRSRYVLMSQAPLDLYVVFNADESIAGITARPAE